MSHLLPHSALPPSMARYSQCRSNRENGDVLMSAASDLVYNKVRDMLLEEGLQVSLIDGGFQVPNDSTAVNISIVDQEDRVLVQMFVPVLHHLPPSPELFEYVATEGQGYFFGNMHYVPDGDEGLLVFEHTLLGDYLDSDELHTALAALAITGNELDEELQQKFGGKRFVD